MKNRLFLSLLAPMLFVSLNLPSARASDETSIVTITVATIKGASPRDKKPKPAPKPPRPKPGPQDEGDGD